MNERELSPKEVKIDLAQKMASYREQLENRHSLSLLPFKVYESQLSVLIARDDFTVDAAELSVQTIDTLSEKGKSLPDSYIPLIVEAQAYRIRNFPKIALMAAENTGYWREIVGVGSPWLPDNIYYWALNRDGFDEQEVLGRLEDMTDWMKEVVEGHINAGIRVGDIGDLELNESGIYEIEGELPEKTPAHIVELRDLYGKTMEVFSERKQFVDIEIEARERERMKMSGVEVKLSSEQENLLRPYSEVIEAAQKYKDEFQEEIEKTVEDESEEASFFQDVQDEIATALPDGLPFILMADEIVVEHKLYEQLDLMCRKVIKVVRPYMVDESRDVLKGDTPEHIKGLSDVMNKMLDVLFELY